MIECQDNLNARVDLVRVNATDDVCYDSPGARRTQSVEKL